MDNPVQDLQQLNRDVRSGLKDFQRETVDRVLEVFKTRNRVLVSDEVGLGKTLIAQGVIAGMAAEKKDNQPLNVVYVCSNATIAEQNLARLRFSSSVRTDDVSTSRLSMQHYQMEMQRSDEPIHLIPLTPLTSFSVSGGGTGKERALIYAVLKAIDDLPDLQKIIGPLGVLMRVDAPVRWDNCFDAFDKTVQKREDYRRRITELAKRELLNRRVKPPRSARTAGRKDLEQTRCLLDEVCRITWNWWVRWHCGIRTSCPFAVKQEPEQDRQTEQDKQLTAEEQEKKEIRERLEAKIQIVSEAQRGTEDEVAVVRECPPKRLGNEAYWMFEQLRLVFAGISLEELKPDLVIMDEFQRFRDLIQAQPDTDTGLLKKRFFQESNTKMLLLSATPYKMYSTLEEYDETRVDEHYQEFWDVMKFLNPDEQGQKNFEIVWKGYSTQLKQLSTGGAAILHLEETLQGKQRAEDALYDSVSRTERCSAAETAELVEHKVVPMDISEDDVLSYVHAKNLLEELKSSSGNQSKVAFMPVDYVKSCPYVMSFLQGYALNDWVKKAAKNIEKAKEGETERLQSEGQGLWLDEKRIDKYQPISPGNARLKCLMDQILPKGGKAARYLWVPPSLPYYPLEGIYKDAGPFTKTLVFSSWQMVPRMISTLVSYEVERQTIGQITEKSQDGQGETTRYPYKRETRYLPSRLKFRTMKKEEKEEGKRPQNMTLFCLLYPSQYLTSKYYPLVCLKKGECLSEIQSKLSEQLGIALKKVLEDHQAEPAESRFEDRAWYYLAPMLLDIYDPEGGGKKFVDGWLNAAKGLDRSIGEDISEENTSGETEKSGKKSNNVAAYLGKLQEMLDEVVKVIDAQNGTLPLGRMPEHLFDVLADMAIGSPAICFHRGYQHYGEESRGDKATEAAMVLLNRLDTPEALAAVQITSQKAGDDEATAAIAHWRNLLAYCANGCLQAVLDEYLHMLASGVSKSGNLVSDLHKMVLDGLRIHTASYPVITSNSFEKLCTTGKDEALRMRTHYAVAFAKTESKKQNQDKDFNRKKVVRQAFNTPFWPFVLATTSIGHEGLDFHNYCRRVVHWNLPSNPIDLEQREGRIHRYKCLAIRQNVAKRYGHCAAQFERDIWEELFDKAAQEEKEPSSSDLIPYWGLRNAEDLIPIERVVPSYPLSRDESLYKRLIEILSLYRLTLGQANQEELLDYLKDRFKQVDLQKLFFNLSPFYRKQAATEEDSGTSRP